MRHLIDIQVKRSSRKLNMEVQGEVQAGDTSKCRQHVNGIYSSETEKEGLRIGR